MILKVLSATSLSATMGELLPQFERQSGCQVDIAYDPATVTLARIRNGETADLLIHSAFAMDEVEGLGKLVPGSRVNIARNGIGVAVLAGANKPDISSIDAFKRALLEAKSIACTEVGASGIYFAGLIERLGIAAQVRAKAKTRPGGLIGELVASGEAEIAIQQIPELLAVSGIDLVGPLPPGLQVVSTLTASLFAGTQQVPAAEALIRFLTTPAAARVLAAKGYSPALVPGVDSNTGVLHGDQSSLCSSGG